MPRIKIVMPANPTAIQNKQGIPDEGYVSHPGAAIFDQFINTGFVKTENTDNSTDKNVITDIHDSVRERSNARKSR